MRAWLQPLIEAACPPAVQDYWLTGIHPLWTHSQPRGQLVARRAVSAQAMALTFRVNRHLQPVLPGQHVSLAVTIKGRRWVRSYSPTRVPGADRMMELVIQRQAGGRVSQYLCDEAPLGTCVDWGQPFGDLASARQQPVLALAAGSGITPFIALLRDRVAQAQPQPFTLKIWAKDSAHAIEHDTICTLAAASPAITVTWIWTQAAESERQGERLHAAHLDETPAGTTVLACGPAGFVETATSLATARGLTVQAEAFSAPSPVRQPGAPVQVTLAQQAKTVTVPSGVPLLEALEAQGVHLPHGCRMGICNSCACDKTSGTAVHVRTGQIDSEPNASLRLCVHHAQTDLVLDV